MVLITESDLQIPQAEIPELGVKLYPFQLASVNAMENLEKGIIPVEITDNNSEFTTEVHVRTSIGFLANRVGSGKTNIILE